MGTDYRYSTLSQGGEGFPALAAVCGFALSNPVWQGGNPRFGAAVDYLFCSKSSPFGYIKTALLRSLLAQSLSCSDIFLDGRALITLTCPVMWPAWCHVMG